MTRGILRLSNDVHMSITRDQPSLPQIRPEIGWIIKVNHLFSDLALLEESD
jgi:hypothetical protein